MARRRRRRSSRRSGSSWKKWLGITALIVLPLGYFAFTRLFFDPFEEPQPSFQALVPRDVDLYVRRERLDTDMVSFPNLRLVERLSVNEAYERMTETDWWQDLDWPEGLAGVADEFAGVMEGAGLDPLADVLGREVALVGRLPRTDRPAYALLARLSNKGKLATAIGSTEALLERVAPRAELRELSDPNDPNVRYNRIDLPDAPPIFFTRQRDLLVIGQDETLVADVVRTAQGRMERSLGATRLYSALPPPSRGAVAAAGAGLEARAGTAAATSRFSAETILDVGALMEHVEAHEDMEERSEHALVNLARRLADPRLLRDVVGRLELDEILWYRGHGELDPELVPARKTGLLGTGTFELEPRLEWAMDLVPTDVSAVVTANVDVRRFLETLHTSLGPDLVELIHSMIRDMGRRSPAFGVRDLQEMYAYLDRVLEGEVTIAMRPFYHEIPKGSQPVPLLAFLMPLRNVEKWGELEQAVLNGYQALGLSREGMWKGRETDIGQAKWFDLAGVSVEQVAYIVLEGELLVVTTSKLLLDEIVKIYTKGQLSLWTERGPRGLVEASTQPRANLAVWAASDRVREILDPYAEWLADIETVFDWGPLREQTRRQVVSQQFPTYAQRPDDLPEDVEARVEAEVDRRLEELDRQRREETIPRLAREFREGSSWMGMFLEGVGALRLGERTADLEIRARTVLER